MSTNNGRLYNARFDGEEHLCTGRWLDGALTTKENNQEITRRYVEQIQWVSGILEYILHPRYIDGEIEACLIGETAAWLIGRTNYCPLESTFVVLPPTILTTPLQMDQKDEIIALVTSVFSVEYEDVYFYENVTATLEDYLQRMLDDYFSREITLKPEVILDPENFVVITFTCDPQSMTEQGYLRPYSRFVVFIPLDTKALVLIQKYFRFCSQLDVRVPLNLLFKFQSQNLQCFVSMCDWCCNSMSATDGLLRISQLPITITNFIEFEKVTARLYYTYNDFGLITIIPCENIAYDTIPINRNELTVIKSLRAFFPFTILVPDLSILSDDTVVQFWLKNNLRKYVDLRYVIEIFSKTNSHKEEKFVLKYNDYVLSNYHLTVYATELDGRPAELLSNNKSVCHVEMKYRNANHNVNHNVNHNANHNAINL